MLLDSRPSLRLLNSQSIDFMRTTMSPIDNTAPVKNSLRVNEPFDSMMEGPPQDPCLSLLPTELVVMTADHCGPGTLSAWMTTCRRFHDIIKPIFYTRDASSSNPLAILWAAKLGSLGPIMLSLRHGGNLDHFMETSASSYWKLDPALAYSSWHHDEGTYGLGWGSALHYAALEKLPRDC